MDESCISHNRKARRSHVLMAASLETDGGVVAVKMRNLSTEGVLVEADRLPAVGSVILFRKKELALAGRIAWVTGRRAGIAFDQLLDPEAVLRHVPSPRARAPLDFRRPPLKSRALSPGERKIAEDWIWGKPIPGVED